MSSNSAHPLLRLPVKILMQWVNSRNTNNFIYLDQFFPVAGQRLYETAGKLDWDWDKLAVKYPTNCNISDTKEGIQIVNQFQHNKALQEPINPHIHILQSDSDYPNFLMGYKFYNNLDRFDLLNWTLLPFEIIQPHVYNSELGGTQLLLMQTEDIDLSGETGVSAFMDIIIYRDYNNDSGLFASAETTSNIALLKQFDYHYPLDANGSIFRWSKWLSM